MLGDIHKSKVLLTADRFLKSLCQPEGFLLHHTSEPETLMEIIKRQGNKQALTFVSDDAFTFFKKLYKVIKSVQTIDQIQKDPKNILQQTVEASESNESVVQSFFQLFTLFSDTCTCEAHGVFKMESDTKNQFLDYELEESLLLHLLHQVVLYLSKVHLSNVKSKMLDEVLQKKKTVQIRHSLGEKSSTSKEVNVEYPCGICERECIEVSAIRNASFEDFFVQCDKCDKWYHYVCLNLTGKEPELQEGSEIPFNCINCSVENLETQESDTSSQMSQSEGKGKGKSSCVKEQSDAKATVSSRGRTI